MLGVAVGVLSNGVEAKEAKRSFFIKQEGAQRTNVQIEIPNEFKLSSKSELEEATILEFIPQNEELDDWSQIITVFDACKLDLNFRNYMQVLEERFKDTHAPKDIRECQTIFKKENGIETAIFCIEKPAMRVSAVNNLLRIPGKKELFMTKVIKTHIGILSIQYSTRFDANASVAEKKLIREKMEDFLQSCHFCTTQKELK
jgi:hypothetical protein